MVSLCLQGGTVNALDIFQLRLEKQETPKVARNCVNGFGRSMVRTNGILWEEVSTMNAHIACLKHYSVHGICQLGPAELRSLGGVGWDGHVEQGLSDGSVLGVSLMSAC